MKLVHIDRLAPGGTALELHPKLTLLRGSGPEVRHRLRSTLRALAGDGAPAETGVIEVSGVPIFAADGRFQGLRGISRDVTERKREERNRIEQDTRLAIEQKNLAVERESLKVRQVAA